MAKFEGNSSTASPTRLPVWGESVGLQPSFANAALPGGLGANPPISGPHLLT